MIVAVPEGISKPYANNNGVFWVKSGADKRRVTAREEIQRMLQSSDLVHADEVPVDGTSIADIPDIKRFEDFFVKQYEKTLNETGLPLEQLLNNLGFCARRETQSCQTYAFWQQPQKYRPENIRNGVSVMRNLLVASFASKADDLPYRGLVRAYGGPWLPSPN